MNENPINLDEIIAPAFYNVFWDILDGKHTYYDLYGGRGSTKSSFVGVMIPFLMCLRVPFYVDFFLHNLKYRPIYICNANLYEKCALLFVVSACVALAAHTKILIPLICFFDFYQLDVFFFFCFSSLC